MKKSNSHDIQQVIKILFGVLLFSIFLASMLFALNYFLNLSLRDGSSAAYSIVEVTLGISITAVASVVALILAVRSLKSSDKEKTIGLLGIYQPEITELFNLLNHRQELLRDFLQATAQVAKEARHFSNCQYYEAFRNPDIYVSRLNAIELRKSDQLKIRIGDYKKHSIYEMGKIESDFVETSKSDGFFIELCGGLGKVPSNEVDLRKHLDKEFRIDEASDRFSKSYEEAADSFKVLCQELGAPSSGLYHRVLSGSFNSLYEGPFKALDQHLYPPVIAAMDGEIFNSKWPKLQMSKDRYLILTQIPKLFESYEPIHFLKASQLSRNFVGPDKLLPEYFQREMKNIPGFHYRGCTTPEQLGEALGRFLPVVSGYFRETTLGELQAFPLDDQGAGGTEDGVTAISMGGAVFADFYPCSEFSNYYSPVFTWLIPLYIRVLSPESCLSALREILVSLDMDGDLLERHLHVQGTNLYSFEAFGDSRTKAGVVPTLGQQTANEGKAETEFWDFINKH